MTTMVILLQKPSFEHIGQLTRHINQILEEIPRHSSKGFLSTRTFHIVPVVRRRAHQAQKFFFLRVRVARFTTFPRRSSPVDLGWQFWSTLVPLSLRTGGDTQHSVNIYTAFQEPLVLISLEVACRSQTIPSEFWMTSPGGPTHLRTPSLLVW